MFSKEFLANKFYIPTDYHQYNRYIPSIYKSDFECSDDSCYHELNTCGLDNNSNLLLYDKYFYCNNYDYENNNCLGDYINDTNTYYVLTNDNNLVAYNMSYYDSSTDDYFLECQGSIALSQNSLDDLMFSNKTTDIIITLMLYVMIPLFIVLFLYKVFRKGVH